MNEAVKIVDALLENDPKELAIRASAGPSPDSMVVFQCPFTSEGQPTQPHYFSDELGDWATGWWLADRFRLGDYIHDGVLDVNDFPFGTESVIVTNPDGSPGQEYTLEDLSLALRVIDTYVSPQQDNEDDRDANPDDYFPRA